MTLCALRLYSGTILLWIPLPLPVVPVVALEEVEEVENVEESEAAVEVDATVDADAVEATLAWLELGAAVVLL